MQRLGILGICLGSFAFGTVEAADRHWNNAAGGDWSVAANWSPAIVPVAADNVFIELAGTYTVTVSTNAVHTNLTINNPTATLRVDPGGAVIATGTVTLTDGTIDVDTAANTQFSVQATGTFHFNGGTLVNEPPYINNGDLVFGPATNQTGTIELNGSSGNSTLSGDVPPNVTVRLLDDVIVWDSGRTNYGTLIFDAGASTSPVGPVLRVADLSPITNEGTVNFVDGDRPRFEAQFINNGVFNIMAGGNPSRLDKADAQHVNNGTINLATAFAQLEIVGPLGSTSTLLNNGSVNVTANGARLRVRDGATFVHVDGADITVSGGGSFEFIAGGRFEFNGGTITGSVQIQDGNLKFGAGPATWLGTIQINVGTLTNMSGNIPSGVTVNYAPTFSGPPSTVTWDQGGTNFGTLNFNNTIGGTVRLLVPDLSPITNEGTIGVLNLGITLIEAMLINNGDITVTAVSSLNALTKTDAQHENHGTINVTGSGKIQLTQPSGTSRLTNNGTINVTGADAWLRVLNGATLATEDGSGITNDVAAASRGLHCENGSTFEFNGGTLTGSPRLIDAQLMIPTAAVTRSGTVLVQGTLPTLTGDIPSGVEVKIQANVGGTHTLTATAPVTIMGTLTLDSTGAPAGVNPVFKQDMGTLINTASGIINFAAGGNSKLIQAELNNLGTFNVLDGGSLNKPGATHTNSGTISIAPSQSLTVVSGTLHESGTTITGGGTLTLDNSTFFGSGTVGANVTLNNASVLNPGASPETTTGILNITGNLTQNGGTTIRAAINGPVAGTGYDRINVTGSATLNGIMNIVYAGASGPCQGESYTVLTKGSGGTCFSFGANITGLSNPLNGFVLTHNTCAGQQLILSTAVEADCNNSCRDDALDISEGFSEDCNSNALPDECDPDGDLDLVPNDCDNCPATSNPSQENTDGDSTGNACDSDDDNDGVADGMDPAALNPDLCGDADADSCDDCVVGSDDFGPLPDNTPANDGPDADSDGICDAGDFCPTDALNDPDNDTVCNSVDNCPAVPNFNQDNTDADALGDACDSDDDNDGVADGMDPAIQNPSVCGDSDSDTCDDCSVGVDGLGALPDNTPANDGPDADSDGLCDAGDLCPADALNDPDNDTICEAVDNCPGVPNMLQEDDDGDLIGSACDNCPLDSNPMQEDCDGIGSGDACQYCGTCQLHGDVVPTFCLIDVDDLICVLDSFVLSPAEPPPPCSQAAADIEGNLDLCTSDGIVDSTDILAALDAFVGAAHCSAPCPAGACIADFDGNPGTPDQCRDEFSIELGGGLSELECCVQSGNTGIFCGEGTHCGDPGCP